MLLFAARSRTSLADLRGVEPRHGIATAGVEPASSKILQQQRMTLDFRGASQRFHAKYGNSRYRCIADGKEIKDVFYYDGRRRIIGVNLRNTDGQFYLTENMKDVARKFFKARRCRLVKNV